MKRTSGGTAARFVLALALVAAAEDGRAESAPAIESRWSVAVGPIVSIQPEGYSGNPYLSQGLGGQRLGAMFGVQSRLSTGASVGLEMSSTASLDALQSGRFISGPVCYSPAGCPTVASTHRDTLVSLVASFRSGPVELKVGPSLAVGATNQGNVESDRQVDAAATAGFDVVLPIGRRVSLVPMARYHFVFRGPERDYAGLGRSIVRLGLGVRLATGGRLTRSAPTHGR